MLSEADQRSLHRHSSGNRAALERCGRCGCFYCLSIFDPKDIKEWIHESFDESGVNAGTTAICPKCGVDSVIAQSATPHFGDEMLNEMYIFWFEK